MSKKQKGKESLVQFDVSEIKEEDLPDESQNDYNEEFDQEEKDKDQEGEENNEDAEKNEDEQYKLDDFEENEEQGNDDEKEQEDNQNISNNNKEDEELGDKGNNMKSQSKQDLQANKNEYIKELPQVEYRKNNYLLFLREVNGGKFIAQKEKARQVDNNNNQFKTLLYYRLGDKNWIEGKLRTIIEVPFERNQTEEEIEIKLITIDEETEVQVKQQFKLHELNLSKDKPFDTFVCRFDSRQTDPSSNTYFKFVLIFDATILSFAEGLSEKTPEQIKAQKQLQSKKKALVSPSAQNNAKVTVFSFTLKDILNYNEFVKTRRNELKDKMILNTSTNWHCRYLIEIQLAKQKCQIYLDDQERDDIYLFYTKIMGQMNIQLIEQIYETFQLDNFGKVTYKETRLKSQQIVGNPKSIAIEDLINKGKGYEYYEDVFNQSLTVKYSLSLIPQKTQFHNKFLGYTSIKILETVVFNETKQPTHMEISMYSMDNELINQVWRLNPFSHYSQNVQKISTWDYQHDLVYKKNSQEAEENIDIPIPEELFKKILVNSQQYNFNIQLKDGIQQNIQDNFFN